MDPAEFSQCVESGLKLAKRIYNGRDRNLSPPKPSTIENPRRSSSPHHPTAPMFYAVISDPAIVDNPDIPSYQPHVHGRCDPPALIPLQMNEVEMDLSSYFDKVYVMVRGVWRVHCVMGSRSCDCRLVVPTGEQGSILGVEIDVAGRSYSTRLMRMEETQDMEKTQKVELGGFLKPQMFTLTVPQVDGGSIISVKISWSQQLLYNDGQFCINVPFSFPEYVNQSGKRFASSEKIQLNLNTGIEKEVFFMRSSHPMKETRRQMGKLGCLYDVQVLTWSIVDFNFTYEVSSNETFGGLLLQSPPLHEHDFDQREMFCFYLFPGKVGSTEVYRKEVVFLVDISGSMRGRPLENAKKAVATALSNFTQADSFSIIAFNGETYSFSSSLELATKETIDNASDWMNINCVAGEGTNILGPLNLAVEMLSNARDSSPQIFLITDGAVSDERDICRSMKTHIARRGSMFPRISTFGLGSYCNYYFLQMLASIGGGHCDCALDADSIDVRMQRFLKTTSSTILASITVDTFDNLDGFEVYPFPIPDLSVHCPVVLSGRYQGKFPDYLKVKGVLADMTNTTIDLKVHRAKEIPLDKVFAKQQIELLTAEAWFSENKELEEKVSKLSMQTGVISEYTRMVLLQTNQAGKSKPELLEAKKGKKPSTKKVDSQELPIALLHGLTPGFGNIIATSEDAPTGFGDANLLESNNVFTSTMRGVSGLCDCCCCYCCIRTCSKMNDQCMNALTQLFVALSCFGCLDCCIQLCCPQND